MVPGSAMGMSVLSMTTHSRQVLLGWMALVVGHRDRTDAPRAARYTGMVLLQVGMVPPLLRMDVA